MVSHQGSLEMFHYIFHVFDHCHDKLQTELLVSRASYLAVECVSLRNVLFSKCLLETRAEFTIHTKSVEGEKGRRMVRLENIRVSRQSRRMWLQPSFLWSSLMTWKKFSIFIYETNSFMRQHKIKKVVWFVEQTWKRDVREWKHLLWGSFVFIAKYSVFHWNLYKLWVTHQSRNLSLSTL